MIAETIIERIFKEVREEYRFPPMRLVIDRNYDTPFYMDFGTVHINDDLLVDEIETKSIIRHEIGHIHFAPVTIKKHKKFLQIIKKELGGKSDLYICHQISNYFCDFVVDKSIVEEFNDDLEHRQTVLLQEMKRRHGGYPQHSFWWVLTQYYNRVIGNDVLPVDREKERETGDKCFEIIKSTLPMEKKLEEITRIMNQQEFMKDFNEIQEFKKFLKELEDLIGTNTKRTITRESMKDKKEAKKELEDLIDDEDDNKGLIGSLAKEMGINLSPFEYYRGLARKKIQFRIKVSQKQSGKIVRGGLEVWGLDDKAEDLDIEESLLDSGVLIPEVSTMQWEKKVGTEDFSASLPSVLLIVDTSGSMDAEKAIVTCFSMIETCRMYKSEFAVILFSSDAYLTIPFSAEYDAKEKEIYDGYKSGGTALLPPVIKAKELLASRSGSLVIFISDLESWDRDQALSRLHPMKANNNITFIVIDSKEEPKGFTYTRIDDIKKLDGVVIDAVNDYIGV